MFGAVSPEWAGRYLPGLQAAGLAAELERDGDALAAALAHAWDVDLVVVDLALATPALARQLGPDGPRVLAFGDAANAGVALAANLADFLPDAPTDAELHAAIEAALATPQPRGVADLSDRALARLGALGAEATRVSDALARMAIPPTGDPPPVDATQVRGIIRARRARDRYFPAEMFGDPAWDMLLDLTIAWVERRDVAVSSLCIAAAVPTTTALRWIRTLCDAGLFERRDDPRDARRAFISLSEPTAAAMARYLAAFALPL